MTIKGAEGMSPENIRDEINRGGRLVIYTYCVSILVMTFKRGTDLRLVKAGESGAFGSWPYSLLTLLLGWWGFPWGPIYTIQSLYQNLSGGIDVTADVMATLLPPGSSASARSGTSAPDLTPAPATGGGFNFQAAAVLLGAGTAVVALGVSLYCYNEQQNLTVALVSGLKQPYQVELNGQTYTLHPYRPEIVTLPEGEFTLRDVAGGRIVGGEQRLRFELPFWDHLTENRVAVINPDRCAVFVEADIPYYASHVTPPADETPAFRILVNETGRFLAAPDFFFTTPDQNIRMPKGTNRLVKRQLEVIREEDLGGMLSALRDNLGYEAVRDHLLNQARHRADESFLETALLTLEPADVRTLFQSRLADRPVLVEWHRYYQNRMETIYPDHDLAAEYRAYVQAEPENGALHYLLGRVTDDDEQAEAWRLALAVKEPCAYAHSGRGFNALTQGRFDEALAHYEASFAGGASSRALRHYRRHVWFALGRTPELVAELAELRRDDPFDYRLMDEHLCAAYLANRNLAAAEDVKREYLQALAKTSPDQTLLDEIDAYLQASLAYLAGDHRRYIEKLDRVSAPYQKFRAALVKGDLDEANKFVNREEGGDLTTEFLLYVLAMRQQRPEQAEQHFAAALEALRRDDRDSRKLASLLTGTKRPDAAAICRLHLPIEVKRIVLTALGLRVPEDRAAYFELARKLNYHPSFPQHLLAAVLAE